VVVALGAVLSREGRYAPALKIFENLARLRPDYEPAYCHRVSIYAELGKHEQAEEMFYLAQELDKDCPHCFVHIATSCFLRSGCDSERSTNSLRSLDKSYNSQSTSS